MSFFRPPPNAEIRILDEGMFSMYGKHFLPAGLPKEHGPIHAGMGPFPEPIHPASKRFFMPVIDLEDNQQKMLSITETGRRAIRELLQRFEAAMETSRLEASQRQAARRFKYSRMMYAAR